MNQSEAKIELEAVLNTIVDGVIIIDKRGSMQFFNPACERIFGFKPEDVLDKNVKMLMPEPYKREHDGYLHNYLTTRQRKIIGIGREVQGQRKDGSVFPMDLAVGEAEIEGRKIFIGVIKDLTHRYEQTEKFEDLQQQHFHLSRVSAMNEMGSAIAHELNQPMTATINYLEAGKFLLEQDGEVDKDKLKNILDKAADQTKRASEIISRLRSFIRTGDLDKQDVDLETCVKTASELALMPFKSSSINVSYQIESNLPDVYINSVQIQQVIVNLIKNACEAMADSEEKDLTISAQLDARGVFAEICVADTGAGIDPDQQELLFTAFSSGKMDGMGVGLSISESIISNHSGRIWADHNEPHGTRFYFTLPVSEGDS